MTETLKLLPISEITPNPYQPRLNFEEKELLELSQSIIENGLIQPIIVRPSEIFGYELIAGERRLRASKLAGLTTIAAIVKTSTDKELMNQAIIENMQRNNLNPIEEALAYQNILKQTGWTHKELAKKMGKSRSYISNMLRLLQLPNDMQNALQDKILTPGHARLLLSIEDTFQQKFWFNYARTHHISVHQLAKQIKQKSKKKSNLPKPHDPFISHIENELRKNLGTEVTINKQQLIISFSTIDELTKIIHRLK